MSLAFSSLIAFIVALGVLVTAHEFGHYWVARRMGVKVLRFSIGFGKPLFRWRWKNNDTEFVLAAIPLGGYVKMLDEREGEVTPAERAYAFNNQSVWSRIAIVCAGPLANVLMAIVVYALVFSIGISGMKPVVGEVEIDSIAAQAGFMAKDRILAVDGEQVETWQQTRLALLDSVMSRGSVSIQVETETGFERERNLYLRDSMLLKQEGDILENIGLTRWWPDISPVISKVEAGSAAEMAGLKPGDQIISTNENSVKSLREWVEIVQSSPSKQLDLKVIRDGETITKSITPIEVDREGKRIGYVGAGVTVPREVNQKMIVLVRYAFPESVVKAGKKTYSMSVLTFKMIGELITGRASVRNISGPITIAEYAGRSFSIDFRYYLDLIAFISISLAVLNILPIPLLDGGHLLYYLVELVKGSPVSEAFEAIGQKIGILLLACLMALAIYNDLTRLLS